MYLSRTAAYALRTMACVARSSAGQKVRAKDLAPAAGVARPFLQKVLQRLTAAGFLTSQKGHGGGFALARAPEAIRFVEVLRAVDFQPASDHCLFGWEECDAANPCPLHPEWAKLKESIENWARTRTLADVLREQEVGNRSKAPIAASPPA